MKPTCPNLKCKSIEPLLYVERVYQYHTVNDVSDGFVDLAEVVETVVDDNFNDHLLCDACGKEYPLDKFQ